LLQAEIEKIAQKAVITSTVAFLFRMIGQHLTVGETMADRRTTGTCI
jgi:hypothetical protein